METTADWKKRRMQYSVVITFNKHMQQYVTQNQAKAQNVLVFAVSWNLKTSSLKKNPLKIISFFKMNF